MINLKRPDVARKRSLQFQPCVSQFNVIPVAMPTCYQTTATAAAAMMKKWQMLLGYCVEKKKKKEKKGIPPLILARRKGIRATHRDVKELLCVVQHADPDGDVASGGHGGWSVARIQRTDAKSLRGSETLPCPGGNGLRVWLCHGASADRPKLINARNKTQSCLGMSFDQRLDRARLRLGPEMANMFILRSSCQS